MMLRICKSSTVEQLRDEVGDNLDRYRAGDFSFLMSDSSSFIELDIDFDESAILSLAPKQTAVDDEYQSEVEASIVVFEAMSNVSPYLAREERLWTYLVHTVGLEYARFRWPIPEDDEEAKKHIRAHFFAKSARQVERDNALSRLWWMAYLCSRVDSISLRDALEAFLYRADVRANIVERPTTSQSLRTFDCVISSLSESLRGNQELFNRNAFRQSMTELNLLGGTMLLEALPGSQLDAILNSIFAEAAKL